MKTKIFLISVLSILIFVGCEKKQEQDQNQTTTVDTLIEFTDDQIKMAKITLGEIEQKDLSLEINVTGVVEASPGNKITLSIPMEGYVKKIYIRHGDKVVKGQPLVEIENMEFVQLQSDYLQKKAKLEFAKQEYQRQKLLYEDSATTLKNYQAAKAEYLSLLAEVKGLEGKLEMIGINPYEINANNIKKTITLRSKIDGYVGEIFVNTGSFVSPTDKILEISNPGAYTIMLDVYGKYKSYVKIGQIVKFTVPGNDELMEAQIYSITPTLDPQTKTFKVHADPKKKYDNLIEGAFVSAKILAHTHKVFVVPKTAVVENRGIKYVYIAVDKNKFKPMPIKTGIEDENFIEVKNYQDLIDKQIVLTGANYIKAKQYLSQEGGEE